MISGQAIVSVFVLMCSGLGSQVTLSGGRYSTIAEGRQQGVSKAYLKHALLKGGFGELQVGEATMLSSGNNLHLEVTNGLSVRFAGVPDFTADQSRRAAGVTALRGDVRIQSAGVKIVARDCQIAEQTNQVRCQGKPRVTIVGFK